MGFIEMEPYREFAARIQRVKQDVSGLIKDHLGRHKKVYLSGASTEGNTMLQYFGPDNSLISAAAERNPDKWGKVKVGTRIPIILKQGRVAGPDFFLSLAVALCERTYRCVSKNICRLVAGSSCHFPIFVLILGWLIRKGPAPLARRTEQAVWTPGPRQVKN